MLRSADPEKSDDSFFLIKDPPLLTHFLFYRLVLTALFSLELPNINNRQVKYNKKMQLETVTLLVKS